MPKAIPKEEIQKKVKIIEAIYQKYIAKLNELKNKQTKIINDFIKELEQRKIEEIEKNLKK